MQKIKLVQKSGSVLGIAEIPEPATALMEYEAIVWEYHGIPQCFVNTYCIDQETGYLVFEHRLTAVSVTSFEDAVAEVNRNSLKEVKAILDRLDKKVKSIEQRDSEARRAKREERSADRDT